MALNKYKIAWQRNLSIVRKPLLKHRVELWPSQECSRIDNCKLKPQELNEFYANNI